MKHEHKIDYPIGGYFAEEHLDKYATGCDWLKDAMPFQSLRAAFLALLRHRSPAKIWLPWYMCGEMIDAALLSGLPIGRYGLNDDLTVESTLKIASNDLLLYVDYFGLTQHGVNNVLQRFSHKQIIIDNAHSFYSKPRNVLANLYSPRKFFGVPDGGYIQSLFIVSSPHLKDSRSESRAEYLKLRSVGKIQEGYAAFQRAEKSLAAQEPMAMSTYTSNQMSRIDFVTAREKRRQNFFTLSKLFGEKNKVTFELSDEAVPLCYPLVNVSPNLRAALIRHQIFIPTFWPGIQDQAGMPQFERNFVQQLLPIPIDQRYNADDMLHISEVITKIVDNTN